MTDDHHETSRPDYNPAAPTPPDREPPLRSTAPQSPYTMGQVGFGFAILFVGLLILFVLPILLA